MPYNNVQKKAVAKYNARVYDEIKVRVSKGRKSELQDYVASRKESLNGFINRAIDETIERDNNPVTKSEQGIPTQPVSTYTHSLDSGDSIVKEEPLQQTATGIPTFNAESLYA